MCKENLGGYTITPSKSLENIRSTEYMIHFLAVYMRSDDTIVSKQFLCVVGVIFVHVVDDKGKKNGRKTPTVDIKLRQKETRRHKTAACFYVTANHE